MANKLKISSSIARTTTKAITITRTRVKIWTKKTTDVIGAKIIVFCVPALTIELKKQSLNLSINISKLCSWYNPEKVEFFIRGRKKTGKYVEIFWENASILPNYRQIYSAAKTRNDLLNRS